MVLSYLQLYFCNVVSRRISIFMNKDTLFILVKRNEGVNLCEMDVRHLY